MNDSQELLENILTAEILILGKMLKAEKLAKGVKSTSDYTSEAASLIRQKRSSLLQLLR